MIDFILKAFSYQFMKDALIVGVAVSLCSALLGVILVLKRYSMIGDGLSHVGFGTLSIATSLQMAFPLFLASVSPMVISIPIVVISAILLLRLSTNSSIKGDAAIAIVSSSALAIGIIASSLSSGFNVDVMNYLFGSILSVATSDVYLALLVAILVIGLFVLFYNRIFSITFDEDFAKATGTHVGFYNTLIAILIALVIVVGMNLMGAMLISCLIIFPALTSMRIFKTFFSVTICSAILSVSCFVSGLLLSFKYDFLPSGATVVVVNLFFFLLFWAIGFIRKQITTKS